MMGGKRGEREEEYFARMEFERKKESEEEKQRKIAEGGKNRLKKVHYMKCPKCEMELIEIDYKGIRVNKCSGCEGIWLDAVELEAISKVEKKVLDKWFDVFKNVRYVKIRNAAK
jgi:uncharacterized protein